GQGGPRWAPGDPPGGPPLGRTCAPTRKSAGQSALGVTPTPGPASCEGHPWYNHPGDRSCWRGGPDMPIHDWSRVPAGIFHDFHHDWIAEIKRTLNDGRLPAAYYALAERTTGAFRPDVLTLQ